MKKLIKVDKEYIEQLELDHRQLKQATEAILFEAIGENGGYVSYFGPLTFSTMLRITGFNPNKRKICNYRLP